MLSRAFDRAARASDNMTCLFCGFRMAETSIRYRDRGAWYLTQTKSGLQSIHAASTGDHAVLQQTSKQVAAYWAGDQHETNLTSLALVLLDDQSFKVVMTECLAWCVRTLLGGTSFSKVPRPQQGMTEHAHGPPRPRRRSEETDDAAQMVGHFYGCTLCPPGEMVEQIEG